MSGVIEPRPEVYAGLPLSEAVKAVGEFQQIMGQGYTGPPRELPASLASLRMKLVLEEAKELCQAIERGELHEQLDAIVDLMYVAIGTATQAGMGDVLWAAFYRVHRANMAKVPAGLRQESKRDSVRDVVKPEGWKPADLKDLVGG
jgi:predicted HAD superfamily Cof-like phosphohydrolase